LYKLRFDLEEGSLADLYILRGQAQHFVVATQAVRPTDEPLRTGKKASAFEGSVHLADEPVDMPSFAVLKLYYGSNVCEPRLPAASWYRVPNHCRDRLPLFAVVVADGDVAPG
jgi:hypothetical protein